MSVGAATIVYCALSAVVILFQLALALGAPWGALAMGGAFPGALPPSMRAAAILQALVLGGLACAVLARSGVGFPSWNPRRLAWGAVGVSAASTVLNLITPSAMERAIWAPVAILLLLSSLRVAASR